MATTQPFNHLLLTISSSMAAIRQLHPPCTAIAQPQRLPSSSRLPDLGINSLPHPRRNLRKSAPPARTSPPKCGSLVFAAVGEEATTSTLVAQEVDFAWKGQGYEVLLTGDFLGWDKKLTLVKGADGVFHAKQKLSPGTYRYKYIVDGKWLHSPDRPTVPDETGGFNNQITVTDPSSSVNTGRNPSTEKANSNDAATIQTKTSLTEKPAGKVAKKITDKTLPELMSEDVIPALKTKLEKEEGVSNIEILFDDNRLEGSFTKGGIIYSFWAYFPDGKLEGSRGFSLSSHGLPPSTVEPFLIDEKKINAELIVFWITKRLFAQKLLSMN